MKKWKIKKREWIGKENNEEKIIDCVTWKIQNWAISKEFGAVYLLDNSRIIMWLKETKEQHYQELIDNVDQRNW